MSKKFYNIYRRLKESPLDSRIASYIYERRKVTAKEIAQNFSLTEEDALQALQRLANKIGLSKYNKLNIEFYAVDKFEMLLRKKELFPSGPIIPLVYQFNLLNDLNRTKGLKNAILSVVKSGDKVIDLGCGNGILSIFASQKAERVDSVEIDPDVFNFADYLVRNLKLQNKISLHFGDALKFKIDEKADILICEMLDTGLIDELQVQITNYALENLLKPGASVIPMAVKNFVQLIHKDFKVFGIEFPLPHFEAYGNPTEFDAMSHKKEIAFIQFNQINDLSFNEDISFTATRNGVINAFRLTTDTLLTEDIMIGSSEWFNPPFIFPFTPMKVKKGDNVILKLQYQYGKGIDGVKYTVYKSKEVD